MHIPREIVAGDSISWKINLPEYPALDNWSLSLSFRAEGAGTAIDITAEADGNDYKVSVSKNATKDWIAGEYKWQAYVEKDNERYTVASGLIKILPSLSAQSGNFDTRSYAKRVLDAIESTILGRASRDAMQLTIGGQSITKMSPGDLLRWRDYYYNLYQQELLKEKIKRGDKITIGKIKTWL